jgi:1,2-diacylglycerol 3-alpha-glucosyltransferase
MKVLMICEFFDPAMEFQENLAVKYYLKHGHEVVLITSTFTSVFDYYNGKYDPKRPASTFKHLGATIHRLPYAYNLLNKLRAHRGVGLIVEGFKPDLIYVHDIAPNFPEFVRYIKRNPSAKMIMDYHADYANSGKNWVSLKILHGVLRRYFLDMARPYLSKIFPIVPAGFTFLNEVYGVPLEEMELLPLGGDIDLIREVQAQPETLALRDVYGLKPDDFTIVLGGKLTPRKRVELLLEAVECPELAHAHVLVAGEFGPEEPEYRDRIMAIAARLGDRIRFCGWQDSVGVYRHMAISDVACFPASRSIMWEAAIVCGLPLVCGNTGHQDISYLNLHDNVRILHGADMTPENYRANLIELAQNPGLRRQMSEGALKTAAEMLDWNRMVQQTSRFVDAA